MELTRACGALPLAALLSAALGCGSHGSPNVVAADQVPAATIADAGSAEPPERAEPSFACDESRASEPEGMRRLTMTQQRNTLRDLVLWALGDAEDAEQVLAQALIDRLPTDRREGVADDPRGGYRRLDQAVDQTHVDEGFRVASAIARALTAPERMERVVGACAVDADSDNDAACFSDFVSHFGARALRRPLDEGDLGFYRAVYGGDPAANAVAYADVLTVLLSSPELVYLVEHGDEPVAGKPGSYSLTAHELAARLSYHFWNTLPDDALWQAAQDGSLLEPSVLAEQVARILEHPRTRETMAEWFLDWLELDALPPLDAHVGNPVFDAFAGEHLPSAELRQHVIDEALDLLAHYTFDDPQGVEAVFTSELAFARGAELAAIYQGPEWDGASEPPTMPDGRAGILSRAWFLASGSANTRPILRGVFVRRRLLCDALPPPPDNANAVPPELRADMTTRQVVEELTEQEGTPCAGCHGTLINPIGFAFEGFDSLGRARSEQVLFHADGSHAGSVPIDSTAAPRITQGDSRLATGAVDLQRMLLESGKLEACLARNYFRFAFGRMDTQADGCALERLRDKLAQSGTLRDLIAEVAHLPELRERRFE